ncbi:MAG: PadR family transcriptional regulator [Thermoleophilia bacterium]|nr:PadR family transcriptional regulator [Thermoleophilia bacterium]
MRDRFRPGFGESRHAFGPMRPPMHGSGPRFFERGGIKFAILGMLKDKPRHGYDIIKEMEERSGGFYSPSPGVIYPTLQALEDQDLVISAAEEGKKVYSITEKGIAFLEEHKERAKRHRDRFEANWGPGPAGEGWSAMADIRDTLGEVRRAVRRSAGDTDKLKEIGAVLEDAAARIKEIIKR